MRHASPPYITSRGEQDLENPENILTTMFFPWLSDVTLDRCDIGVLMKPYSYSFRRAKPIFSVTKINFNHIPYRVTTLEQLR